MCYILWYSRQHFGTYTSPGATERVDWLTGWLLSAEIKPSDFWDRRSKLYILSCDIVETLRYLYRPELLELIYFFERIFLIGFIGLLCSKKSNQIVIGAKLWFWTTMSLAQCNIGWTYWRVCINSKYQHSKHNSIKTRTRCVYLDHFMYYNLYFRILLDRPASFDLCIFLQGSDLRTQVVHLAVPRRRH